MKLSYSSTSQWELDDVVFERLASMCERLYNKGFSDEEIKRAVDPLVSFYSEE